jgi:hypothetical protein
MSGMGGKGGSSLKLCDAARIDTVNAPVNSQMAHFFTAHLWSDFGETPVARLQAERTIDVPSAPKRRWRYG